MSRLTIVSVLAAVAAGCDPGPPRPPIVLIVMDALGAEHVSHLGYERETTPHLDALAAEGITFTQAFSPAPYTQAGIASLLTGLLPGRHLVVHSGATLRGELVTLAEILRAQGYRTRGAVSNLNGSSALSLEQGFDSFLELFREGEQRERILPSGGPRPRVTRDDSRAERETLHVVRGDEFPPVVAGWLEEGDELPFYYLHLLEPHCPYQPPEEFRTRFLDPEYAGPFGEGDTKTLVQSVRGEVTAEAADVAAARALYDANLAYGDAIVGEIFDLLRAAGLYDEALIVVTSDHGEAFWQHDLWGHNLHLYDEMIRVPLIVKLPDGMGDVAPGTRSDALVSTMDVLPSLCDWLDLPGPRDLDGIPLASADGPRSLVLRTNHKEPTYGLRTQGSKLILHENPVAGSRQGIEFFDLASDPGEQSPLELTQAERASEQLDELLDARFLFDRIAQETAAAAQELSPNEEDLLDQLGYTE